MGMGWIFKSLVLLGMLVFALCGVAGNIAKHRRRKTQREQERRDT